MKEQDLCYNLQWCRSRVSRNDCRTSLNNEQSKYHFFNNEPSKFSKNLQLHEATRDHCLLNLSLLLYYYIDSFKKELHEAFVEINGRNNAQ